MAWHNAAIDTYQLGARKIRDVSSRIIEIDGRNTPFTYLLRKFAKKATTNPMFEHYARSSPLRYTKVNNGGGYNSSATAIVVDDATVFRVHDTIVNLTTQETMHVTDITVGTNTLTVIRNIGTTGLTIADEAILWCSGTAAPEGDTRVEPVSAQPTARYNYTQIFKTTVMMTGTAMNSDVYGPDEFMDDRDRKARQHNQEIEARFLFGQRHIIESADSTTRFTQGIIPALGTGSNVNTAIGTVDLAELDDYLWGIFTHGNENNVKIGYCNMYTLSILNKLAGPYIQINGQGDTFGWDFRNYRAYYGTLKLLEHRLLTRMFPTSGVLLTIDPDYVKYRHLQNRDTRFIPAQKGSDLYDGYIGEYQTECGLQLEYPEAHGWLAGISGLHT